MQDKQKDIKTKNIKNEPHGYWEVYWDAYTLWHKCFYFKWTEYGYEELYRQNGNLIHKRYYARK